MERGPPDLARRYAWRRGVRTAGWVAVAGAVSLVGWRLATDPLIRGLSSRSLDYRSLALALIVASATQLLYCSRWHWFLRVVQVPVSWLEAVSAALMAQLVGSLAIGSAGSDVYRGVVTGRGRAGHRMGVVASILADRVAGLYSLVCLAALAATFTPGTGRWQLLRASSLPVLWAAVAVGGACILAGLFFNLGPALAWTRHWPLLHRAVVPMLTAVERFRSRPGVYGLGIASGIVSHALGAATLWLVARGLGVPHPSLADHLLIGPLAACTGLLPLPMAGLGAAELVVDELYKTANPEAAGAGLVTALVTRIFGLLANVVMVAAFLWPFRLVTYSSTGGATTVPPGLRGRCFPQSSEASQNANSDKLGLRKVTFSEADITIGRKLTELASIFMIDVRDHYFGRGSVPRFFSELDECEALVDEYGRGVDFRHSTVLEIGYGPRATRLLAMISLGIDAIGIDVDSPVVRGSFREFLTIYQENGLERALKSLVGYLCFGYLERYRLSRALRQLGSRLLIDEQRILVGDAGRADFAAGSFDVILSHDVFEHITPESLQRLLPSMAEWLKPGGLALIRPNIFTGISGGHLAEWFSSAPPKLFKRMSDPWEHLRRNRFPPNTYLNKLSRAEYRCLFSDYFEILEERVLRPDEARPYLTPEVRRELHEYTDDELLGGQVLFVLRRCDPSFSTEHNRASIQPTSRNPRSPS